MLGSTCVEYAEDYDHSEQYYFDFEGWYERLDFEMKKYAIMQRMFVQMKTRMDKFQRTNVLALLKHYKVEVKDEKTVRGRDFLEFLGKIGVIRTHHRGDTRYLLEEYQ